MWPSHNIFTLPAKVKTLYSVVSPFPSKSQNDNISLPSVHSYLVFTGHILEHEFFSLGHLGSSGSKEKSGFELFAVILACGGGKVAWHNSFHLRGGNGGGGGRAGMAQNHFSVLIPFFKTQFKNTSNLILLGFKMSSESFFHKKFKTGLTLEYNTESGSKESLSIAVGLFRKVK